VSVDKLPTNLNPPPPAGANLAFICRSSFFVWETARWLTVARMTPEGVMTNTISRSYPLDRLNKPIHAYNIQWVAYLLLFIYLVALEHRLGATVGKELLGLRVTDARDMDQRGIPLGKAIARNLLLWIGLYPMILVLLAALLRTGGNVDSLTSGGFFLWFMASGLLGIAIFVWIVVAVACKRDPVYDALSRTAVVRR
jgi:hypothetical protein